MIILNIISSLLLHLHPFHVSVMNIDHSDEENSLQITLKIFADDLEEALNDEQFRSAEQAYIDVLNPRDEYQLNVYIERYLEKHLSVFVNRKKVQPKYLGMEREDLAMWCYLEVSDVEKVDQLQVRNAILTEIFDDQINIVHVNYQNKVKSMKLAGNQLLDEVTF